MRERTGPVFAPLGQSRDTRSADYIGRTIAAAGRAASIVVKREAGEANYATAQDLRRTFGCRWAPYVAAPVLKEMMRHRDIETTMTYYVVQTAERIADAINEAAKRRVGGKSPKTQGGNRASRRPPKGSSKPKNT